MPNDCLFCKIARKDIRAVTLWEDDDLLVFLDKVPIREGHCQIITKAHYATFEEIPASIAAKLMHAGQALARHFKILYAVERAAFLFTGGDVAHAHAHVLPMHAKTDITSERYILNREPIEYGAEHLEQNPAALLKVRERIGPIPGMP